MKKLLCSLFLVGSLVGTAQKTAPPELTTRLNHYLNLSREMRIEQVMEYTHPKLFTIAPKEAIVEAMNGVFKNSGMTFRFDSMRISSVSPAFKFGNASYHRINYYSALTLILSDSMDLSDPEFAAAMLQSMKKGFVGKQVRVDAKENAIKVAGREIMFAVKDPTVTDWMFLGYDRGKPELNNRLYPKAVRQNFKLP